MSQLIHTEGIVIKTMKYGETSLISQILTADHGMLSLIIGSVANNAKKGMFQLMSQLDLVIYLQENKTMHRIKEVKYAQIYQSLPFEINRSAIGIFMLELIRKTLKNTEIDSDLYHWVKSCLNICDQLDSKLSLMPIYFLVGLSRFLGFCPLSNYDKENFIFDLREGCFTSHLPFHREYLEDESAFHLNNFILSTSYADLFSISISTITRKNLLYALLDYYKIHLDHFQGLDSPYILEEILAA